MERFRFNLVMRIFAVACKKHNFTADNPDLYYRHNLMLTASAMYEEANKLRREEERALFRELVYNRTNSIDEIAEYIWKDNELAHSIIQQFKETDKKYE